jgi:hypothetical protein
MKNVIIASVSCAIAGTAVAQSTEGPEAAKQNYSPYVTPSHPTHLLFGDTHLHTSYSVDAGMIGNTLGPADAYRFAKGEKVISSTGVPAKLIKPLDFLMVADHAEALGVAPMIARSDPALLKDPLGKELHALVSKDTAESRGAAFSLYTKRLIQGTNTLAVNTEIPKGPWEEIIDAAEAAYDPGTFTALIGFEFSASTPGGSLHRVVMYRDGKDVANKQIPLSAAIDSNPETLWDWMAEVEQRTGGRLLAIPHNGNQSNGLMFDDVRYESTEPISAEYAQKRQRWEPLYETTQMKGDGEAHPALSPDDGFADFETWDNGSPSGIPKTPDMLPREYARAALKRGLSYEQSLGDNPFKFGLIGSTDAHTSLSTARENNFFGKVAQLEPSADPIRFEEAIMGRVGGEAITTRAWQTSASGLAAVWSVDNTREAIFDALQRKEVYGTTGTRMQVRVFAGYDFVEGDASTGDFAAEGYRKGVPMGADLPADSSGRTPGLIIQAIRDPDGANLDRIQVVKGWLLEDGSTVERVYDVACAGRALSKGDCTGPVGNTVDEASANWSNTIGKQQLSTFWQDPDFDPAKSAFYYVRVLEIPTPRWTTYDAKIFGVERPEGAPVSIQERAYTSPIWFTP